MSASPFGERLAEAMKLAELPQREGRALLAKALGITVQAVGMVLNGQTKAFKPEQSAKAARFLKVDHYWLATGEGSPKSDEISEEALSLARQYDRLDETERRRLRVLMLAARNGMPDHEVEQYLPTIPKENAR